MTDTSSSVWRTAYISTLFEKDAVQLVLRIAEAAAAIDERLNSSIEIRPPEHEAIEAARKALTSLKAQHVSMVGETLGPADNLSLDAQAVTACASIPKLLIASASVA
jgi:hypothetical protein